MKKSFRTLIIVTLCIILTLACSASALAWEGTDTFPLNSSSLFPAGIETGQNVIRVCGVPTSSDFNYLWLILLDDNGNRVYDQVVAPSGGTATFSGIRLRDGSSYNLTLYANDERYSSYSSIIYDNLILEWTENKGTIRFSPVYEANMRALSYEATDSAYLNKCLKPSADIQSDAAAIRELAAAITAGLSGEYEKAIALHNWICDNIYYDYDAYYGRRDYGDCSASGVLSSRCTVCEGYANLTTALLRAAGIPARTVHGYAVSGVGKDFPQSVIDGTADTNHAWNRAYVEGRWITIDATWDSANAMEYGAVTCDDGLYSYKYFDTSDEFFASTHAMLGSGTSSSIYLYVNYPKYWTDSSWHDYGYGCSGPVIRNGATFIPVRALVEEKGGTVDWQPGTASSAPKITLRLNGVTIELWQGSTSCRINGQASTLNAAPQLINGFTMIPVRGVMEAAGCQVTWAPYDQGWNGVITIR